MKSHQGSIAIISNQLNTRWLIQRKDGQYPIEKQRRTICFFGGSVEASESPLAALTRELDEEIRYEPFLKEMFLKIDSRQFKHKTHILPSEKNPGTEYELNVYRFQVNNYLLGELGSVLYKPGIITEGYGEIVSREYLRYIVDNHPDDFFSTISVVVDEFV